jgi:transposase
LFPVPSHVEPVAPSVLSTRTRRRARRSFTTKRKAKRRGTCPPVRCRVFWQRRGTGVFTVSRPFLLQPAPPPANDADASKSVNGLPAGWTEHKDAATGKCYYYNASTVRGSPVCVSLNASPTASTHTLTACSRQGKTSWEKPTEGAAGATQASALPAGWTEHFDAPSNKTFYYNATTVKSNQRTVLCDRPPTHASLTFLPPPRPGKDVLGNTWGRRGRRRTRRCCRRCSCCRQRR